MPLPGAPEGFQDYLVVALQEIWPASASRIDLAVPAVQLQNPPRSMAAPAAAPEAAPRGAALGVGSVQPGTKAE